MKFKNTSIHPYPLSPALRIAASQSQPLFEKNKTKKTFWALKHVKRYINMEASLILLVALNVFICWFFFKVRHNFMYKAGTKI